MVKKQESSDDLKTITKLLQNLLAIELWRGGLQQAEIGKRLGVRTVSVSKMLKGVNKRVITTVHNKE